MRATLRKLNTFFILVVISLLLSGCGFFLKNNGITGAATADDTSADSSAAETSSDAADENSASSLASSEADGQTDGTSDASGLGESSGTVSETSTSSNKAGGGGGGGGTTSGTSTSTEETTPTPAAPTTYPEVDEFLDALEALQTSVNETSDNITAVGDEISNDLSDQEIEDLVSQLNNLYADIDTLENNLTNLSETFDDLNESGTFEKAGVNASGINDQLTEIENTITLSSQQIGDLLEKLYALYFKFSYELCDENLYLGSNISSCEPEVDETELPKLLGTGTFVGPTATVSYTQELFFQNPYTGQFIFTQDDADAPVASEYLFIDNGNSFLYNYYLTFDEPVLFDPVQDDLTGSILKIQGKEYTILDVSYSSGKINQIVLVDNEGNLTTLRDNNELQRNGIDVDGTLSLIDSSPDGEWYGFDVSYAPDTDEVYLTETPYEGTWGNISEALVDPAFNSFKINLTSIENKDYETLEFVTGKTMGMNFGTTYAEIHFTNNDGTAVKLPISADSSYTAGESPTELIFWGVEAPSSTVWNQDELMYLEGETCTGPSNVVDCQGAMFLVIDADENAHLVQITNVDTNDNTINFDDLTYGTANDNMAYTDGVVTTIALTSAGDVELTIDETAKSITFTSIGSSDGATITTKNAASLEIINKETSLQTYEGLRFYEYNDGTLASNKYLGYTSLGPLNITAAYDDVTDNSIEWNSTAVSALGYREGFGLFDESDENDDSQKFMTWKGTLLTYDRENLQSVTIEHPTHPIYVVVALEDTEVNSLKELVEAFLSNLEDLQNNINETNGDITDLENEFSERLANKKIEELEEQHTQVYLRVKSLEIYSDYLSNTFDDLNTFNAFKNNDVNTDNIEVELEDTQTSIAQMYDDLDDLEADLDSAYAETYYELCNQDLYLGRNISACQGGVIIGNDFALLADGAYEDTVGNTNNSATYTQTIGFETPATGQFLFTQDDDDAPEADAYLFIDNGADYLYKYMLIFDQPIVFDSTTEETAKEDLIGTSLTIQGETFTITDLKLLDGVIDTLTLTDSKGNVVVLGYDAPEGYSYYDETVERNGVITDGGRVIFYGSAGELNEFSIYYAPDPDEHYLSEGKENLDPVFEQFTTSFESVENDDYEDITFNITSSTSAAIGFTTNDGTSVELPLVAYPDEQAGEASDEPIYWGNASGRLYLEGETCTGIADVTDCTGTFFLYIDDEENAHLMQIIEINTDEDFINIQDVSYSETQYWRPYTDGAVSTISLGHGPTFDLLIDEASKSITFAAIGSSDGARITTYNGATIELVNADLSTQMYEGLRFYEYDDGTFSSNKYLRYTSRGPLNITAAYDDVTDHSIKFSWDNLAILTSEEGSNGWFDYSDENDAYWKFMTNKGTLLTFDKQNQQSLTIEHPMQPVYAVIALENS